MRRRGFIATMGAQALLLALPSARAAQDDDPVVVVSPTVAKESISRTGMRAVFGMRLRNWPDGDFIRVFVLHDEHPVHESFCKKVISIYPHQLRLAWDRLVFSGTGQAPTQVATESQMRARVASTPGAVGYLRRSMVDDNVRILGLE